MNGYQDILDNLQKQSDDNIARMRAQLVGMTTAITPVPIDLPGSAIEKKIDDLSIKLDLMLTKITELHDGLS